MARPLDVPVYLPDRKFQVIGGGPCAAHEPERPADGGRPDTPVAGRGNCPLV
jgi:hypothetical protein